MNYDIKDFQTEVLERSWQIPVLVDFWAEWCGPCKVLGPVLERLATEANGTWQLAKVNTEELRDVAAQYNIRSIPNVKLFVDGKFESEFVGALPEPMVKQWLQKNIPSKFRKDVEQSEQLIRAGKSDEAQTLLKGVIEGEPENHKARVLLAQILLEEDIQQAVELVRTIEEDSEVFDAAEMIRTFSSLMKKGANPGSIPEGNSKTAYLSAIEALKRKDYSGALKKFIDIIREDRYYDDDGSRLACIAIFKLLGEEHEITQEFRREFSRALY